MKYLKINKMKRKQFYNKTLKRVKTTGTIQGIEFQEAIIKIRNARLRLTQEEEEIIFKIASKY